MLTNSSAAPLTELKIDTKWRVKYNPKEWSYLYLKPLGGVSSNIFEHRKDKIRIVLQKESHLDEISDYQKLIEKRCAESNKYYSKNASGYAEVVKVNKKNICYIEFKNAAGEIIRQFVYPDLNKPRNYDLYSYAWNSNNQKTKETVTNFLKGFVQ
jgi:hypothetical protein